MIVKESFNWKNPSLKPNSPKPPLPGRKDSMKVTFSDTNNPNIVRIFCMCHCLNALQFHFDFEEDEDGDIVYINALMDARHYKCASPIRLFWERLKAAWLVLTGKDRPLHDICLRRDEWFKFYEQLTEFNNKIKENMSK